MRKSQNRIVIDYNGKEELVLLAVIHTATGEELSHYEMLINCINIPIVETYDGVKDFESLKALNLENKEGFVIKFKNGFRMKIKFEDYLKLHRILTNVSSRTIWEYLKDGKSIDELIENVPDEFYDWVKMMSIRLLGQFFMIKGDVECKYMEITNNLTKVLSNKQFAIAVFETAKDISGLLFLRRENRNFDEVIWKRIYPEYECPFKN